MLAAVITGFGAPERLQIREVPTPVPAPGEVRIRVRAIGLNFADVMARLGLYPAIPDPPFIPGLEVAGEVESLGQGVTEFAPGDRVAAFTPLNGYAELVCTPASFAFRISPEVPWTEAAAMTVASLTAYHGLVTLARLQSGERLLVHAAAGGVGLATIQIAKHLGAEVFATAGSEAKLAIAREHGADHLIDYRKEDFARIVRDRTGGYGVDVVMDSVAGRVFRKGMKLLAPMGRYVLFGFAAVTGARRVNWIRGAAEALTMPILFPHTLPTRNNSLHCFNLFFLTHKTEALRAALDRVAAWHQEGIIRPVVGSVFPFAKIAEAQAYLQGRHSHGKVVVVL